MNSKTSKNSMFQIAIYNEHQHEQFSCSADCFALRGYAAESGPGESGPSKSRHWTPVWDQEQQPATSQLRFRVTEDRVTVEATTEDLRLANGHPLQSGKPLPLPCLLCIGATGGIRPTWIEIAPTVTPRSLVPLRETNLDELLSINSNSSGETHLGPSAATVTNRDQVAGRSGQVASSRGGVSRVLQ